MSARLTVVASEPMQPAPDMSYEWRDRQRIAAKDWARIHTLADRRAPIFLPDNHKRTWRA